MIDNAKLKRDADESYWLHVESSQGPASINLSEVGGSLTKRNLEAWAQEQLGELPYRGSERVNPN